MMKEDLLFFLSFIVQQSRILFISEVFVIYFVVDGLEDGELVFTGFEINFFVKVRVVFDRYICIC